MVDSGSGAGDDGSCVGAKDGEGVGGIVWYADAIFCYTTRRSMHTLAVGHDSGGGAGVTRSSSTMHACLTRRMHALSESRVVFTRHDTRRSMQQLAVGHDSGGSAGVTRSSSTTAKPDDVRTSAVQ